MSRSREAFNKLKAEYHRLKSKSEIDERTIFSQKNDIEKLKCELRFYTASVDISYIKWVNGWIDCYEDVKSDFELSDDWASPKYDKTGTRIKEAYKRFKAILKARRLDSKALIEENARLKMNFESWKNISKIQMMFNDENKITEEENHGED